MTTHQQPALAQTVRHTHDIDHEVLIIGAGIGGLGIAIRFLEDGIDSFQIIERAGKVGGTWRDNRYPGIAVDITSLTYSYSFAQKPDWTRLFAPGQEVQAYVESVAEKHGLHKHLRFNTEVAHTRFDEQHHVWVTTCTDGSVIKSRHVVAASGGLISPKMPDIAGIDTYQGEKIHTGRWDDSIRLEGKRVAVIGTGATAVQLVPEIARIASHLSVFQRTPIWVLPKPDHAMPPLVSAGFRHVPGLQRGIRLLTDALSESTMVLSAVYFRQLPWLARSAERMGRENLARQLPDRPDLRAALQPDYGFACKRPTFSNEYFSCLGQDHVALVTTGIDCITEKGIRTRDGLEHEFDAIIFATGYRVFEKGNLPSFEAFGRNGRELGSFWDEERYQAYEGVTVPGFPNYFTVLGPYGLIGTSYFKMVEGVAIHISRCVLAARKRGKTCVEVSRKAHDDYFGMIQKRMKGSVLFNNHCGTANSYYFDKHGDAPLLRPMTSYEMFLRARFFPMSHYQFQ